MLKAGLLNVKEKGMNICYIMNRCFFFSERSGSKCRGVLMKHCPKVKGEQVIILQMAQQLKTQNINVVVGQLFCHHCKAKFSLEAYLAR